MADRKGLLLVIGDPRLADRLLEEQLPRTGTFTDVLSVSDYQGGRRELSLLSFDARTISHAATVERGARVATAKLRVRFSNFVELQAIPFARVSQSVPSRFRPHVTAAFRPGGRMLPPATWRALWAFVKDMSPESRPALERLERRVYFAERGISAQAAATLAQERDALGLAAEIFGVDRRAVFEGWTPPDQGTAPIPFLAGLRDLSLPEDTMIVHDSAVFGEWLPFERMAVGTMTFEREGKKLTVMNVNRTHIEETLGVDLLYYHHDYQSYVFVQYKRMSRLADGSAVFRPMGPSYEAEISRMRAADRACSYPPPESPLAYRINAHAFFMKLCPRIQFDATTSKLLTGMYFPMEYWELLTRSAEVRGPRGGVVVSYENAARWIGNSLFIQLVQDGWVGSAGIDTPTFTRLVRAALDQQHSVLIALTA